MKPSLAVWLLFVSAAVLRAEEPLPPGALERYVSANPHDCSEVFAFAADGKVLAVGSARTPQVPLFDVKTGRLIRSFRVDGSAAGFSPDGKRVLIDRSALGKSALWDMETGKRLQEIPGYNPHFTDHGRSILTLNPERWSEFLLHDAATGRLTETVALNGGPFLRACCPTAPIVALGQQENKGVKLVSLPDKKVLTSFAMDQNRRAMSFSGDGKRFAYGSGKSIHVWDIAAGKEIRRIDHRWDGEPALSADGRQLAWSGYDEKLGIAYTWVCDVEKGEPRHVGPPTNHFGQVVFSPDGQMVAFQNDSGVLELRDVRTDKDVWPLTGHTNPISDVHFTAAGQSIVSRDRNRVIVWDRASGRISRAFPDSLPDGEKIVEEAFRLDDIITVAADGTLRQRDVASGNVRRTLEGKHGFVFGAAAPASVSADGKTLALQGKDYSIRAYDLETGRLRCTFVPPCAVWSVWLSPDGRWIAWTGQDHPKGDKVRFLEAATGKAIDDARLPKGAFPLGRWWRRDPDQVQQLRDLKLKKADGTPAFSGEKEIPHNIYLSPQGRHLVARQWSEISKDDAMREIRASFWHVPSGRLLPSVYVPTLNARGCLLENPPEIDECGVFSSDGRLFAGSNSVGEIHVWELATGQKRHVIPTAHRSSIHALEFSPDGRHLLTGGSDARIFVWALTGRGTKPAKVSHPAQRLNELFGLLIAPDAAQAGRAIHELIADPEGTIRLLKEKIPPATKVDERDLARLIADLDADAFARRMRASAELMRWDERILPAVRAAEKAAASEEQRRRLKQLIDEIDRPDARGETLRMVRAVEVAERIGTAEAKLLLRAWADGASGARLTDEAREALGRVW